MMFSSTVIAGTKASSWWMKLSPSAFADCGVSGPVFRPSTRIEPPSGCTIPARILMKVDLPAPLAPTNP